MMIKRKSPRPPSPARDPAKRRRRAPLKPPRRGVPR